MITLDDNRRLTIRADDDFFRELDAHTNGISKNEFIKQAVRFYCSYLNGAKNERYLTSTISSEMNGIIEKQADRVASHEYRMAVELCKLSHIIASACELTGDEMNKLHRNCVREINDSGCFPDVRESVSQFRMNGNKWKQEDE